MILILAPYLHAGRSWIQVHGIVGKTTVVAPGAGIHKIDKIRGLKIHALVVLRDTFLTLREVDVVNRCFSEEDEDVQRAVRERLAQISVSR